MTTEEFSNEFDTLLNSHSNIQEFGKLGNIELDEYEKSIFLTKAQEEVVISLYNGRNVLGDSFEGTEELRRYLDILIKTTLPEREILEHKGLSKNSIFYKLPKDLMFITYESVDINDEKLGCKNGETIRVIPVSQDDYSRIKNNPFKGANSRKVLRLDAGNNLIELIPSFNITNYLIRYISKPEPIILEDLPNNLSIDNIDKKTECKLNPALHRAILEKAVRNALISKSNAGK